LPYRKYVPTARFQILDDSFVALPIRSDLGYPVFLTRFWGPPIFAAVPVPKAAVNKYDFLSTYKNNVWAARKIL
jgi:hypothetical protein